LGGRIQGRYSDVGLTGSVENPRAVIAGDYDGDGATDLPSLKSRLAARYGNEE
jgi:hypothetical protein